MTSLIQRVGKLAIQTFRRENGKPNELSSTLFEQLNGLVNTITLSDINLDLSLLQEEVYNPNQDGAPVIYMHIYEDADLTISVFILKNGVQLPLHDHPRMHGLLKVIYGAVDLQCYSRTPCTFNSSQLNDCKVGGFYQAVKHPSLIVTNDDPVCVVTPDTKNLHAIASVNGAAAFLDILSPPYGKDCRLNVERDCHYFKEFSLCQDSPGSNSVWLMSIPAPIEFWCDPASYKGPPISDPKMVNGAFNS